MADVLWPLTYGLCPVVYVLISCCTSTTVVYQGAPNIKEFELGNNSFVNVDDFDSPRKLAERAQQQASSKPTAAVSFFKAYCCCVIPQSLLLLCHSSSPATVP